MQMRVCVYRVHLEPLTGSGMPLPAPIVLPVITPRTLVQQAMRLAFNVQRQSIPRLEQGSALIAICTRLPAQAVRARTSVSVLLDMWETMEAIALCAAGASTRQMRGIKVARIAAPASILTRPAA